MTVQGVLTAEEHDEHRAFAAFMHIMKRMRRAKTLEDLRDIEDVVFDFALSSSIREKLHEKLGFHKARITEELAQ